MGVVCNRQPGPGRFLGRKEWVERRPGLPPSSSQSCKGLSYCQVSRFSGERVLAFDASAEGPRLCVNNVARGLLKLSPTSKIQ